MSIQGKVNEINSIKQELKCMRHTGSVLRKRMKQIEEEIYEYDYEILSEYIDEWARKHLPKYHLMLKMLYGIDDIYSKPKKIAEIAKFFSMPMENVKKQKQRLLIKIKNNIYL